MTRNAAGQIVQIRPLRCAVYARVSSEKQDTENSLDRQLRACSTWAQQNGHEVLREPHVYVDEAKSGASMLARPAFQRLLAVLRDHRTPPFDAVLVDDDSRLDRGGHLAEIVETFQARGVRLISVDGGRDLTDESERLLVHVKSGMNEQYLRELARRTRSGLTSKVLKGFHGGGKIYGYRLVPEWPAGVALELRDRDNRVGTRIEVNATEAAVVRRVFEMYAKGIGFREIAKKLNAEGVPSSRGKPTWDPASARVMLLNPKYIGDWAWKKSRWQKKPEALMSEAERTRARLKGAHPRQRIALAEEEWIASPHPELRVVPDDLWRTVQQRFTGRARPRKGSTVANRIRSPIAALLRCECGGSIASWSSAPRKGKRYTRLYCARNRNRGPEVCRNSVQMRIEEVADPLLAYVHERLLDPARVLRAVEEVNRRVREAAGADANAERRRVLEAEIAKLAVEVDRLIDLAATGTAIATVQAKIREKDARLNGARQDLARLAAPTIDALPTMTADKVRARLGRLWEDIRNPALDADKARLGLEQFFGGIAVKPLDGSWENGWLLEMQTRPWAIVLPKGASASEYGCGGAMSNPDAFRIPKRLLWSGPRCMRAGIGSTP